MTPSSRITAIASLTALVVLGGTTPALSAPTAQVDGAAGSAERLSVAARVSAGEVRWEKKILALTNKRRAKANCKPLKLNTSLRKAARKHSDLMAKHQTLSHQLPGEASLGDRITKAGYRNWRGVAENVAYGYPTPSSMMAAWMASPGHRKNILNCSYRHLGVGVTVVDGVPWATQDFGRK